MTGRTVVVAGTYRAVESTPVGPFAALVAVPRGLVAAAEVIGVILLVGGAWSVVDKTGTLARVVDAMSRRLAKRRHLAILAISIAFAAGGALENMQEEIIPLIPVLLVLAQGLGFDVVTVVAMSAGAAMVGSAFSPINPFQAGIALRIAELPLLTGAGLRVVLLVLSLALWIWWTIRHATRTSSASPIKPLSPERAPFGTRHWVILLLITAPFVAYVIGVLKWGWGFNELSAVFLVAGIAIGVVGRLGLAGSVEAYVEGMRAVVGAAVLVGVARSISLVLEDGRVIDTILQGLVAPLAGAPRALAAILMVPVPLSDLLGLSRDATVLAFETGAGLTELWTPTNGSLMAILLAAGVPYGKWIRFVLPMVGVLTLIGIAGILIAA